MVDPIGSIGVILWREYCEKGVVKDNTYIFKCFRYSSNKFGNYVNMVKDYIRNINVYKTYIIYINTVQLKSATYSKKFYQK